MQTSVGNSRGWCGEAAGTVANTGERMGSWHLFLYKIARERAESSKRTLRIAMSTLHGRFMKIQGHPPVTPVCSNPDFRGIEVLKQAGGINDSTRRHIPECEDASKSLWTAWPVEGCCLPVGVLVPFQRVSVGNNRTLGQLKSVYSDLGKHLGLL